MPVHASAALALQHGQEQLALRTEVVVDRPLRDPGPLGDVVERGGGKTTLEEACRGTVEECLMCRLGIFLATGANRPGLSDGLFRR
jgi:hypothetical protein